MKTLATVLLCVGVLFLQGCTYVPAVEPTDLSPVYEESATRSEIEAVLGEPLESRETKEGSISIYIYDRGAEGGFEAPFGYTSEARIDMFILPFAWVSTPFLYADKVDEQEGYLAVVYSADDTVSYYDTTRDIDRVIQRLQLKMRAENQRLQLKMRAENGDPDAQWKLATSPDLQWERWLCVAAHGGKAEAQHRLGKYYRHGGGGVKADGVAAYLWLSLAERNGEIETVRLKYSSTKTATGWSYGPTEDPPNQTLREIVANSMTPDQITDGERLLAEWEPNPAECEVETAATTH